MSLRPIGPDVCLVLRSRAIETSGAGELLWRPIGDHHRSDPFPPSSEGATLVCPGLNRVELEWPPGAGHIDLGEVTAEYATHVPILVFGPDGEPLVATTIARRGDQSSEYVSSLRREGLPSILTGLSPGTWRLRTSASGYSEARQEVVVTELASWVSSRRVLRPTESRSR